jgi:hypothetical protein
MGHTNVIEYNDFSTSANTSDFGDLTDVSIDGSTMCSTVRAVLHTPFKAASPATRDVMEYVTVASTGNSSDFGDLSLAREKPGSASDGTTGEMNGGTDGTATNFDVIDKITIGTTGNASDVGDLLEDNKSNGSTSGN